jgi:hypothetical protein
MAISFDLYRVNFTCGNEYNDEDTAGREERMFMKEFAARQCFADFRKTIDDAKVDDDCNEDWWHIEIELYTSDTNGEYKTEGSGGEFYVAYSENQGDVTEVTDRDKRR